MTKHTPGHEYTGTTLTAQGDLIYGETPEDGLIARVYGAPRLARQFAASDEMLAALRMAKSVLATAIASKMLPDSIKPDLDAVQSAIAEATGAIDGQDIQTVIPTSSPRWK